MKKLIFLFIIMIVSAISLNAIVYETDSFSNFFYGTAENCEYDDWISHIAKGVALQNYNLYAPFYRQTSGFGDYVTPSTQDLENWNQVVTQFMYGNYEDAEELIEQFVFPYQVVQFTDTDTDRVYYMLREILDMTQTDDQGTPETTDDVQGAFSYGWGLYVVWPESDKPIIINVVHPNDDFIVPPLAVKSFQDWDAKYFMFAGAGREVKWTNSNPYYNSKSLSDPSRVANHPFNKAYIAACDEIRLSFGRTEFSAQLHSYDWNRHVGHANLQISPAPNSDYPNLPIRDLSSRKMDLINQTDYLVIPENTVGIHEPVYINDFYTVYYDETQEPFYYDNGEEYFPVNNMVSLPGYSQSVQYFYTHQDISNYDVVDNFFHIEFDELPNAYPQNTNNYHWFYGYDLSTNTFNMDTRFDRTLEYYGRWVDLMKPVLFEALELDDGLVPDVPLNFSLLSQEYSRMSLTWDAIDQYDFMSYEIHFSESEDFAEYNIHDRNIDSKLASSKFTTTTINGLLPSTTYYLKIRARDYNDNYSDFSETIQVSLGPANISNYNCRSIDAKSYLTWSATYQYTILGYRVYRATEDQDYVMIADWESNPELLKSSNNQTFNFIDDTVDNFVNYVYKIAMVDTDMNETIFYQPGYSSPRPTYAVVLQNTAGTISDTLWVGNSPFASDGQDTFYDVVKSGTLPPQYVQIIAYESTWNNGYGISLSREIFGSYDANIEFKRYRVRVKSNQNSLKISLTGNQERNSEKVILVEQSNSSYTNLLEGEHSFTVSNTNYKEFWLYIGNVQPVVQISTLTNRIYKAGDNLSYTLSSSYPGLLDYCKISIVSETDSLLVNDNFEYTDQAQTFNIPDDITIHNAYFVVDAYCTDGEVIRYKSNAPIGIIPASTTISYNEGNNFIAHPFPANPFDVTEILSDASLFMFTSDEWQETEEIAFGNAYYLNSNQAYSASFENNIQRNVFNKSIFSGWNFIPNPHLRPFNIKDLDFIMNNQAYSYGELYQQDVLMPKVRVIREGLYVETDMVYPGEAFFIYANINSTDNMIVQFLPYKQNLPINNSPYYWQGILTAKSLETQNIMDEVILSCIKADTDDIISISGKQPEPIALPNNMSFFMNENTTSDTRYNRLSTNKLSTTEAQFVEYPFTMELPNLDSFKLTADYPDTELNYQIVLILGENEYQFTEYTEHIITPQETTLTGYVRIVNEFLTGETDVAVTPLSFSVYPNPFNPTTNISFNINKATQVDVAIYNIKGQKVKTLNKGILEKGNHILSWTGTDHNNKSCASGIYFISVSPKGYSRQIKKISLIK